MILGRTDAATLDDGVRLLRNYHTVPVAFCSGTFGMTDRQGMLPGFKGRVHRSYTHSGSNKLDLNLCLWSIGP